MSEHSPASGTSTTSNPTDPDATPVDVDVVVVGGGGAGLSAATVLARSRRSVVVVDAGHPRNAPAAGVHAFLGHDGLPPGELLARGRAELASYGSVVVDGTVVDAVVPTGADRVSVTAADGTRWSARHLVVTTGVVDTLPDVPGLAEHWGTGVIHCPYCHGWEVRDQRVVVLATSTSLSVAIGTESFDVCAVLVGHGVIDVSWTGPSAASGASSTRSQTRASRLGRVGACRQD